MFGQAVIDHCQRQLLPCHVLIPPVYGTPLCVWKASAAPDYILAPHGEKYDTSGIACKGNADGDDVVSDGAKPKQIRPGKSNFRTRTPFINLSIVFLG